MDGMRPDMFISVMDRPIAKARFSRALMAGICVSAAWLAAIAWLVMRPAERTLDLATWKITVSRVVAAPFHDFIPLRGEVVPLNSIVLDAVQPGRIEAVMAEAGQRVNAGQALLRLSDPALELDAIARETQVIEQINGQHTLQLSLEATRTNDARSLADATYNIVRLARQVGRRQSLAATGYGAQEKLDESVDELAYQQRLRTIAADAMQRDAAVIRKSSEMSERTASRLEANLAAAKRQLDALIVRAPTDGVLTGLDVHVGEETARGQHLGQVDRDGGFMVTADVDEFFLARVRPGQHLEITLDGRERGLIVRKIYPQVKAGKFRIDLAWDGVPPAGLRRGQAVQGKLGLDDDTLDLVLPAGPFLEASGGNWVFVVSADGAKAVRRQVRLGRRNAEAVEVLSGLVAGDHVITSDYTGLDRIDRINLAN
jgi:HlyD family secretion protein